MQLVNDGDEPAWDLGIEFADWPGRIVADTAEHRHGRTRAERRAAGTHGVEHTPQAE